MKSQKSKRSKKYDYKNPLDSSDISFDDDFIFSGTQIVEVFQNTIFATADTITEENCVHEIHKFSDGRGYCGICGANFVDTVDITDCIHEIVLKDESGINVCRDCGKELDSLDFSQEWRSFGNNGSNSSVDTSRCHKSKSVHRGIRDVLEDLSIELPPSLIELVEAKFNRVSVVTENKVLRGKGRESLIAVCLFYAYQSFNEYRPASYIRAKFKLEQKNMSNGFKLYYRAFPEDRTFNMSPEKLIPWIMKLTGIGMEHYRRILMIAEYLSKASQLVERSNPQSVAAAIIYFYLCLFPDYKEELKLTKSKFAEKAELSDITISKIFTHMVEISRMAADEWINENSKDC